MIVSYQTVFHYAIIFIILRKWSQKYCKCSSDWKC